MHQKGYISKLSPLQKNAQYRNFRSSKEVSPWTTSRREEVSCAMGPMAQVPEETFQIEPAEYTDKTDNVF